MGSLGEQVVKEQLEANGAIVRYSAKGEHMGDLTVLNSSTGELISIEVKTAKLSKDRKYRFTLRKDGSQDCSGVDYVVLLVVLKTGFAVPYVIPGERLEGKRQACITSHPDTYSGQYSSFKCSIESILH